MDLSFGLTIGQQWALFVGLSFVLSALISGWALFAYDRFTTKANWTSHLEQLKHRNNFTGR